MARSPFKAGNVVLCEYVAKGDGNKHSLVNVFSGHLIVPSFPAVLHLGLYAEVNVGTTSVVEIDLEISYGETLILGGDIQAQIPDPEIPAAVVLQAFQFQADEPGELIVKAGLKGGKQTRLLRKKIMLNPDA